MEEHEQIMEAVAARIGADRMAAGLSCIPDLLRGDLFTVELLRSDLKRLWHFAGCPFDHCQTCIDDAAWIKSLEERLGPPSAKSVIAQHDDR